jgi:fatty acid desaturase
MAADDRRGERANDRMRFRQGLPGYHDPTAGIGGAAPARSALTLRLWLALFGLVSCTALAIWLAWLGAPTALVVVLVLFAVVALVDIGVIVRRKRRGEPG